VARRTVRVVRGHPPSIDVGVRDVVELLNRIPGVTTRASCEGVGHDPAAHRHGDLAYVLFRYPLPLRLRDFLLAQLDPVARVENDGIHSRWPVRNREFLDQFLAAVRAYPNEDRSERRTRVRCPLPKLRSRLARAVARGRETRVSVCLECEALVVAPHPEVHQSIPLLYVAADQQERWFTAFVASAENALDAALIEHDGWPQLLVRTMRGDFGVTFRRRWLRYRARMIADLTTHQLYRAARDAHHQRTDLDCFFDDAHVILAWA
jgi:hypothetical protein